MTKEVKAQLVVSEAVAELGQIDLSAFPRHDLEIRGRVDTLAVRAIPDAAALPRLDPLRKEKPAPMRGGKEAAARFGFGAGMRRREFTALLGGVAFACVIHPLQGTRSAPVPIA